MDSVAPPAELETFPLTLSDNTEAPPVLSAKERYKQTRKANQLTQKAIDQELDNITAQVDRLIYESSKRIKVEVAELTGQFLAKSAATHEKKPTAWNGLVSKVSLELAHRKEDPKLRGAAFMRHVVQYIHENNLYKDLTDSQKEELVEYAQNVRDSRVNAGQVKTVDQRLTQGSVKDELFVMYERLGRLHSLLGIEFIALTVRGTSTQGLKPVYATSPKARQFFESHLKLEMAEVVTLFAESVVNGAAGVAKTIQKTKAQLKTTLRELLLNLFRDTATKPASDGWEPVTEDRYSVKLSYVNFKSMKDAYAVDVHGWPMEANGSMKDPSNIGGSQALRQWIAKVESGHVHFSRMTKAEHQAWLKDYNQELATETTKVRSKAQKRPRTEPSESSAAEPPKKKKNEKKKPTTKKSKTSTPLDTATHPNPTTTTTEALYTPAEATVLSPALSSATVTPLAVLNTPITLQLPEVNNAIETTFSYEMPQLFDQQDILSVSGTNTGVDNLSHYCFPSSGFDQPTGTANNFISSPTYPLFPVGAGRARQDSFTSQMSNSSFESRQPATPSTSRRRKDNFVNISPAEWLAKSQKPRQRRTRADSSASSRVATPTPEVRNTYEQGLNIPSLARYAKNTAPTVSLYHSELADPRM